MQITHAAEGGEKDMVVARVLGDQHDTGDAARGVRVLLKGRVPEIFRKMLLAGRKADLRRSGVARKSEREGDLDRRAVGTSAGALEMHRVGYTDLGGAKLGGIRAGIAAFEDQQRKPLLLLQKHPVEGAEQCGETIASELVRLGHREQFDEKTRQLDDAVVGTPGMPVARTDGEAEPAIELGRRVEIVHRMNDMVETAGHRHPSVTIRKVEWFSNHNHRGLSSPIPRGAPIDVWAARHGNPEMLRDVLDRDPPIETRDLEFKGTAMGWLIHGALGGWPGISTGRHDDCVRLLLDAGAQIDEASLPTGNDALDAVLRGRFVSE